MRKLLTIVTFLDGIFDDIARACAMIGAVLIIAITLIVTAGVINRQFIGQIWLFVEEWTALVLIPISYLTMGYTLRWNKHIYVDLLVKRFSPRAQHALSAAVSAFSLLVLGFMLERSWNWFHYTLKDAVTSSGPMRTPLWIFSASMFAGLVLFAVDMLFYFLRKLLLALNITNELKFHD